MSDLFGTPPAPAPAPPPARRARAPGAKAAPAPAAPAQVSRPATELQVVQAEPPAGAPPAPRGRMVTLHDGRQVDSWSMDWVWECLASTLLQLEPFDRNEWLNGFRQIHGDPAEQDLRRLVRAVAAARRGDQSGRR